MTANTHCSHVHNTFVGRAHLPRLRRSGLVLARISAHEDRRYR
jgi:hypothetical protein